jgi:hypothetical protein
MASVYKILGQSSPSTTAVATLYTVPASTQAVVSTITANNLTGAETDIDIYIVPAFGTASAGNSIVYQAPLAANTTQGFTFGITLGAADTIQVKTGTANNITFQAFGQEIS